EQLLALHTGPGLGADRVVVVAATDRLVEDRRVRRQAGHRIVVDVALDRAVVEQAARDVVEPEALPRLMQNLRCSHALALPAATHSRATCATRWGVNPNLVKRSFNGADAPKVCIPTTALFGPLPTYRYHPNVAACSIATRVVTAGGSTCSRYSFGCRS